MLILSSSHHVKLQFAVDRVLTPPARRAVYLYSFDLSVLR